MSPRWYKAAFAAMAVALASACAGVPKEQRLAQEAAARSECEALAERYADVVREQGLSLARYGSAHPRRAQLIAQRDRLRADIADAGAKDERAIVAAALGQELADARAERARAASRYGETNARVIYADEEIAALESALAAETGRRS